MHVVTAADVDDVADGAEADGDSRISSISSNSNNVSIYISISRRKIISRSNINRGSGGRSNQKKRLSHSRHKSLTA